MIKHGVVLTGGIACGKSTVSSIFELKGCYIIDADKVAKEILDTKAREISYLFQEDVVTNNLVDRAKLGKIIFSDSKKRTILDNFMHPLIKQEIMNRAQSLEMLGNPYIIDIPLFFETNNYEIEKSIVVYTTPEIQLKQLMERNGLSEEQAMKRINSQMPIDKKKGLGTYLIENIGSLEDLEMECYRVYGLLKPDIPS